MEQKIVLVGVFAHGLTEEGDLSRSTKRRVRGGVRAAERLADQARRERTGERVVLCFAPDFEPGNKRQRVAMRVQMMDYARSLGTLAEIWIDRPATTFITEGEIGAFVEYQAWREVLVSSWWHMPRIKLLRKERADYPPGASITTGSGTGRSLTGPR